MKTHKEPDFNQNNEGLIHNEVVLLSQTEEIQAYHVKEVRQGEYVVWVELRKGETRPIYTHRQKTVRTWASMDRLIQHIRRFYRTSPPIVVWLYQLEETEDETDGNDVGKPPA